MLVEAMGLLQMKEAVDPLLTMLKDPEKEIMHRRAIEALGRIGDARAVGPLLARLQQQDGQQYWSGYAEVRALVC